MREHGARRRWRWLFPAMMAAVFLAGAVELDAQLSGVRDGRFALPGSIEGTLYAPVGSGKSLAGVTVTASPTETAVVVDAEGRYTITGLRPGNYTLEVSGEGFSRLKITDVVVRPNRRIILSAEEIPILLRDGEVQRLETFVVSASKRVQTLERFEVTGDRQRPFSSGNVDLPRTENDAQPYTIFDRAMIEQSSAMTAEEFVRSRMPMSATKFNLSELLSDSSDNKSMVNLSGLGIEDTLILVNGRRVPSVPLGGAQNTPWQPDLNGLPLAAIDRIEVLPTSASAIYGGRATGGVMNIVLRQDFEGTELGLTYENVFRGKASTRQASLVAGRSFENGRTHALLALSYTDTKPVLYRDREDVLGGFRARAWANDPSLSPEKSASVVALGTTPNIMALPITTVVNGNVVNLPGTLFGPDGADRTHVPAGYASGDGLDPLRKNAGRYNIEPIDASLARAPYVGLRFPLAKAATIQAGHLNLRRDFSPNLELFVELSHSENLSRTALDGVVINETLPATAPTNIFGTTVRIVAPVKVANVVDRHELSNDGAVAGFKLELPREWVSEGDLSFFRTSVWKRLTLFDFAGVGSAVRAGELDLLRDTVAYPPYMDAYAGWNTQHDEGMISAANLRAAGPAWQLAAGDVMVAAGAGYQEESSRDSWTIQEWLIPRETPSSRRTAPGLSQQSVSGYGELLAPFFSKTNAVRGINQLDLQIAARADYYEIENLDTNGTDARYDSFNLTAGFRYRPLPDLMVRASEGSAFQPPEFSDIKPISPPLLGLPFSHDGWIPVTVTDPKRGVQPSSEATTSFGGNPHVRPDRTRSSNLGIVIEPRAVPGLRVAVDLTSVRRRNGIATLSAQTVVESEEFLPGRVVRGPVSNGDPFAVGPIRHVDGRSMNFSREESVNYNFSVDYRRETRASGAWQVFVIGNSWQHYRRQFAPGQPLLELVNGAELVAVQQSKFTGSGGVNWTAGSWAAGWSSRFFGAYRVAQIHQVAQGSDEVKAQLFHDVYFAYTFKSDSTDRRRARPLAGLSLQIGAKDVFNTEPAFDASNQTTFHSYYGDLRLGRYYLTVRKKF